MWQVVDQTQRSCVWIKSKRGGESLALSIYIEGDSFSDHPRPLSPQQSHRTAKPYVYTQAHPTALIQSNTLQEPFSQPWVPVQPATAAVAPPALGRARAAHVEYVFLVLCRSPAATMSSDLFVGLG